MSSIMNRKLISNSCKLSSCYKNFYKTCSVGAKHQHQRSDGTKLGLLSTEAHVQPCVPHGYFARKRSNVATVCRVLSRSGNTLFIKDSTNAVNKATGGLIFANGKDLPIYIPAGDISADEFTKLPLKCRSCGAFMQTHRADVNGYILPKKLPSLLQNTFEELICSNCFSLRSKNKALSIGIDKDNVFWQFQHIAEKEALILYVVDIMDIAGSVLPEIMKLIGENKHVIIIGNKADMLASHSDKPRKQEYDMLQILKNCCVNEGLDKAAIKDVCLMSGLTGHGVEKLVVLINRHRAVNMDLYVVGSTNSGKSTIFNMLQNLSAISKDARIPTQACAHFLPGTTVGLVRHPVAYWRMKKVRRMLLEAPKKEESDDEQKFEFVEDIVKEVQIRKQKPESINVTEEKIEANESALDIAVRDEFAEFIDLHSLEKERRWMYDTPGLMNCQQITQFLTPKELKFLQQKLWIVPRTFTIKPGRSLLLGGLARIDYCEITRNSLDDPSQEEQVPKGIQSVFLTVFCSHNIPIHPTTNQKAPSVLENNYGNHILKIPFDDENRPGKFPNLEAKDHELVGIGWHQSCADLCIAGLGWIAVMAGKGSKLQIKLHTPNGIGQQVREDCLIPYSVTKRGKRGVRYAGKLNRNMYQCTRKDNPQLMKAFDKQNEVTFAWLKKIQEKQKFQRFERRTERQRLLIEQGVKGKIRQLSEKVDVIEKQAAELKAIDAGKQ